MTGAYRLLCTLGLQGSRGLLAASLKFPGLQTQELFSPKHKPLHQASTKRLPVREAVYTTTHAKPGRMTLPGPAENRIVRQPRDAGTHHKIERSLCCQGARTYKSYQDQDGTAGGGTGALHCSLPTEAEAARAWRTQIWKRMLWAQAICGL